MRGQDGFTYVSLMIAVVIVGILSTQVTTPWKVARRVDQEEELLFRGQAIQRAIEVYYLAAHPGMSMLPERLEDLLGPKDRPGGRFIRKLYRDPITGDDWVPILINGRLAGVHSASDAEPLKKHNFPADFSRFEGRTRYSDWRFEFDPNRPRGFQPRSAP